MSGWLTCSGSCSDSVHWTVQDQRSAVESIQVQTAGVWHWYRRTITTTRKIHKGLSLTAAKAIQEAQCLAPPAKWTSVATWRDASVSCVGGEEYAVTVNETKKPSWTMVA